LLVSCVLRSKCWLRLFFFQAEDGIRDATVTGVQTCALPISTVSARGSDHESEVSVSLDEAHRGTSRSVRLPLERGGTENFTVNRSEERRVGKECRSRRSPSQYKTKRAIQQSDTL